MSNQPLIFWKPNTRREFLKKTAMLMGSFSVVPVIGGLQNVLALQPFVYEGSRAALVTFTTDPDRIRKTVPEPFKANDKGIMTACFVHENKVKPTAFRHNYRRAVLAIPVMYEREGRSEGLFIERIYTDGGATMGRKRYGYPNENAKISWSLDQNMVKSKVATMDDTEVAHVVLALAGSETTPQSEKVVIHFNARGNSISTPNDPSMTKIEEKETKRVSGQVIKANFFGIEIGEVLEAVYREYDWVLPPLPETVKK